ncbi:MAG: chemotaxis protein CheW [Thermodesulfobacteriota bacterium]
MALEETSATSQYLTFKLDEEYFTVNVRNVREILEYMKITKMPDAPHFMQGIINVRGGIVPVIDLRQKFSMGQTDPTPTTRIVVMEIKKETGNLVIGTLADSVKEVIELTAEQIEPPPDIGSHWQREYLKGVGKYNNEFIMLLDIDKLFSQAELTLLEESGGEVEV